MSFLRALALLPYLQRRQVTRVHEIDDRQITVFGSSNCFRIGHDLLNSVAKRPISRSPLRSHARQHRHQLVDVVDDETLGLFGMPAGETTDIPRQRALPRDAP